jgi:hypothetical protein
MRNQSKLHQYLRTRFVDELVILIVICLNGVRLFKKGECHSGGNMVGRLFKYGAALLVGCAALGITQGAFIATGLPAHGLARPVQCPFQPDGYFYLNEPRPGGFDAFDHIELRVTGKKGESRPVAYSRLYTKDGKSYKFAQLVREGAYANGWGITFQFETETIDGVSYQFSGRFIMICVLAAEKTDPTRIVADGRITKLKDGEEAATAAVQFTYSKAQRLGAKERESTRYPQDAAGIIVFVEAFSEADFFVKDAIKKLGTAPADYDGKDGSVVLTPFPSQQTMIKNVVLEVFEGKPNRVTIEYINPVRISYGALKERYDSPRNLAPPVVHCKPRVNCQPAFVGYTFSFTPDFENKTSGKSFEVAVDLTMEWSKVVPRHTDKDFLEVKEIQFRRVLRY